MALDFNVLTQVPTFGERFAAGRRTAQEEAQRNMLLQQRQMEFQQSQEDRRLAAEERQRKAAQLEADRGRRQTFLTQLRDQMAKGGYRLNRESLSSMLDFGIESGEKSLVDLATKGLQDLDDEDQWQAAFGGGARPPAAAAAPAPAAPQLGAPLTDAEDVSRANALGRTDPRFAMATPVGEYPAEPPAPVANAMVAPPADAERQRLNALLNSPNKGIRDEARERLKMMDAAAKAQPDILPKPEKMQLGDRVTFVDVNPRSPTFRQEMLSQQVGAAPEAPGAAASRAIQDRRVQLEAERLELERKRVAQQAERDAARERRDAAAQERLDKQLAQTDRRLAIAEEDARRAGDPAFQQRMANARVTGEAIAKGDVTAQRALPQLISRAEEGVRLIDELIGRPEERDASGKVVRAATKPHPGFEDAVGSTWKPGFRFIPGTNAANFMARFDQIQGQSFLEAFETLKGGGAITEKEGTKGTEAINRARIAQSETEFISAMRDLQSVVRKGVENAKRKASLGPAALGGAPAAGVDTNNPLLK